MAHVQHTKKLGWIGLLWLNIAIIGIGVLYVPDIMRPHVVISRVTSPALGDSFVLAFNQPVDRAAVLASLRIEPHVTVQTIWDDDGRGLQLIPQAALMPDTAYTVTVGDVRPAIFAFAALNAHASKTVQTEESQITQQVKRASLKPVTPGGLPQIEETHYVLEDMRIEPPIPRQRTGTYIDIDLTREILTIFTDGRVHKLYNISAQGPPHHPTPTGEFEIGYTNTNHLSSISNVWMPWSMQFFGDYFIHEVPYYPNGQVVTTEYSGGCIRLAKGIAEEVYNIAEKGMKVVVYRS